MVKVRYFAWVRERIGKAEEDIVLPDEVISVGDLLNWLKERDEGYANALQHPQTIRVAINQEHADHDEPVAGAREIALFPPMTGG
ncbi:molybdopterin converting factor subunit 1 [Aquamicrobium zhengzhouense]|uniref:Molybdopterin synthase sulfur carrier subunit n=1 Tax=Aquamicrobium zhengzhouense TaxID=2781738 RepID=A0ABS0SAG4_9HYPH|nr:molybdopterin converting factor subunit 1 [Aquamicrobium zhengzhouense]MBI1620285.1 molybdopterin converting factor subunit 1 [Aquamicrobium zhengzhouense]